MGYLYAFNNSLYSHKHQRTMTTMRTLMRMISVAKVCMWTDLDFYVNAPGWGFRYPNSIIAVAVFLCYLLYFLSIHSTSAAGKFKKPAETRKPAALADGMCACILMHLCTCMHIYLSPQPLLAFIFNLVHSLHICI